MPKSLPPCCKCSRSKGFTLVELLAVVAIMILLLTFTVPVIRGGNDMTKTAWDMAGIIDQARAYAMAQNTYVWVGFNETQATVPANQINTAVFTIASRNGTTSTAATNLSQVGKTTIFQNLTIADLTNKSFGDRKGPTDGVVSLSSEDVITPALSLPGRLSSYSANRMIRIDPDGSVKVSAGGNITAVSMVRWLEVGLQPTRGTTDKSSPDYAAVQITGLTGQTRVYRP